MAVKVGFRYLKAVPRFQVKKIPFQLKNIIIRLRFMFYFLQLPLSPLLANCPSFKLVSVLPGLSGERERGGGG